MLDTQDPEVRRLLDAVDAAFEVTGAGFARWPAPHPDRAPLEEEYSRVTDPHKWAIAGARADAWVQVLVEFRLADAREVDPAADLWRDSHDGRRVPARAVVVTPRRAGALPMLLAHHAGEGSWTAGVVVGLCTSRAGPPAVRSGLSPDCGCDACDDGSDGVLVVLDEAVLELVTGEFLHVLTPSALITATATGRSWSSRGAGFVGSDEALQRSIGEAVAEARSGTSPHPVVMGASWLTGQTR